MNQLFELRHEMDAINTTMLDLFLRRMDLAGEIAAAKQVEGLPVLNVQREQEILDSVTAQAGIHGEAARRLFSLLLTLSREYQTALLESCEPRG